MIEELSTTNKTIGLQYRFLKNNPDYKRIQNIVDNYLIDYCKYYNIDVNKLDAYLGKFINRYQNDMNLFLETGKYPLETGMDLFDLTRIEYDLFLLSSILFTKHRFAIANNLNQLDFNVERIAFIGVGSGVEIALAGKNYLSAYAYDVTVSDFIKKKFEKVVFRERFFAKEKEKFNVVVALELLEHVVGYKDLIVDISETLVNRGAFVCTIACNVPQFDHVVNFDVNDFENFILKYFIIVKKVLIKHDYKMSQIDAKNVFYVLMKR
jgi:hypothetical protein